MRGNPRCLSCNGSGVVSTPRGYAKCSCIAGTRGVRDLLQKAHERPGLRRLTMTEMLSRGRTQQVNHDVNEQ